MQENRARRLFGAKDIVLEDTPETKKEASAKSRDQDGYGKVLIGATSAGEKSWESDTLKQSVFTYYFVDGLQRIPGVGQGCLLLRQPLTSTGKAGKRTGDRSDTSGNGNEPELEYECHVWVQALIHHKEGIL